MCIDHPLFLVPPCRCPMIWSELHFLGLSVCQYLLFADRVDQKTFVNLSGAQLLGPALSAGAVYVASILQSSVEILCIKGNVSDRLKPSQDGNAAARLSRYTAAVET